MNLDDLEWQSRSLGGYPPVLVDLLVEQGHIELLVRAASKGAWSCASAAARELCKMAEYERALGVLEPFVELGWKPARRAAADVELQAGRVQQALDGFRPDAVGSASEHVCRDFAELLVKAGRVDEAITVLIPHLDRAWMLSVLVKLTEGQNRDKRVLELLAPKAERARSARGEERWNLDASNAQDLQAQVLERAGRVDEAVRILRADIAAGRFLVQNTLTAYAELLQRNGRMDELRELGVGEHAHVGLPYYAKALEDRGRADEAESVLRRFLAADEWDRYRWPLIELLARQGRMDEAVEVGRPTFDHHDACLLESVIHLLAEAGRFDDALAILDERDAEYIDEHASWFHTTRIGLLGEAGRYEEALAYAGVLPTDLYGLTSSTAWILEQSGRVEEALGLLRADPEAEAWEVAALLVRHGRADEAIEGMPPIADLRAASRWG
ncbi:tetratricopeptide repeat protein (plasmid) [Streptomyces sp. NA03103]|uniref:tetratricopeptide repeat protein n=1 Tax=unclassified Streptomyces TaxID=2593676 RepID=UPI0015920AD6|nr:tetratricopeptide repeat protein [Streptomyces sp. NA03103]QKW65998.1 tetratricopeptide repeat protein [Streptomyces sp. NA03103]